MSIKDLIPLYGDIKHYNKAQLKGDLSAGLTVGVMLIPQGMAYAMLAGLPPIYGLYASTIPLILYAFLGTSRHLAVGPVAIVSLLIVTGVGSLAELGSPEYISLTILLALMVGIIQMVMGILRVGFLVNFLSHPVISGFTSAAAIIIGMSQLKHLLGLDIPRSNQIHLILMNAFEHISYISIATLSIGILGIVVIIALRKHSKSLPGPLIVVLLSILAVYFLDLQYNGVQIVKEIPSGLPALSLPAFEWKDIKTLLPIAITISFVGFMESTAVAKAVQKKHKSYKVVPNSELIALGAANIGGSFFQAFPTTGGFSRTAVNDQAGAKTGMASIISALLIILTLIYLTPLFYYLPKAILASIIMVAVFGLIDINEAKHLWKTDRSDFYMFIAAFAGTLLIGIEEGVIIGVSLSIGVIVFRTMKPHMALLGRIKGTVIYRNIYRFEEAQDRNDLLVIRFDARLYFANVAYFQEKVEEYIEQKGSSLKLFILEGQSINSIDSTGMHMLFDLLDKCKNSGIEMAFVGLNGPIRDTLYKAGFVDTIGKNHFFNRTNEAVEFFDENGKMGGDKKGKDLPFQTNMP